jgi:hypothetical protein
MLARLRAVAEEPQPQPGNFHPKHSEDLGHRGVHVVASLGIKPSRFHVFGIPRCSRGIFLFPQDAAGSGVRQTLLHSRDSVRHNDYGLIDVEHDCVFALLEFVFSQQTCRIKASTRSLMLHHLEKADGTRSIRTTKEPVSCCSLKWLVRLWMLWQDSFSKERLDIILSRCVQLLSTKRVQGSPIPGNLRAHGHYLHVEQRIYVVDHRPWFPFGRSECAWMAGSSRCIWVWRAVLLIL